MTRITTTGGVAIVAALLTGCATSAATPSPRPVECSAQEQLVCSGKSGSRLERRSNDIVFCRCEPLGRISN